MTEASGKKKTIAVSSIHKHILDTAVELRMEPDSVEIAFMAQALVKATLPHSDPGNIPIWGRTNGKLSLTIKPDWKLDFNTKKPYSVGIPYGTVPRLLLFWITTEAVRTKSRRLELGNSLSAFMRELGLTPTGGRWGSITRLREQMTRLFRAKISFELHQETNGEPGQAWIDMQVTSKGELWWTHHQSDQSHLWKSWIELSDSFFEAICAAPVPIDLRALKVLKNSSMALDLYAWLNYRTFTLQRKRKEQFIPWSGLVQQLGANYTDLDNFRKKAKTAIKKVMTVCPRLNIKFVDGGLVILSGKSAILSKHY